MMRHDSVRRVDPRYKFGAIPIAAQSPFEIRVVMGKGRGVFTRTALRAGQDVMCDPVERYTQEDARYLARHRIYDHLFVDPEQYGRMESVDLLLVIGPISIINHFCTPNCQVQWHRDGAREWALLRALTDIPEGAELLIHYTNIEEYEGYQNFL